MMLFALLINFYFVPWQWEKIEVSPDELSPLQDRVYIHNIPVFYRNRFLNFWNFQEISKGEDRVQYFIFEDSLLAPEVLLYSIRGEGYSEAGGFVKTPVFKKENQLVLSYCNLKDNFSNPSVLLASFKGAGALDYVLSFGDFKDKKGFALGTQYRWISAYFLQGDLLEASLKLNSNNGFFLKYYREGEISSAILGYRFLSLGLGYADGKVSPYGKLDLQVSPLSFRLELGRRYFSDEVEERLYAAASFHKGPLYAGIEGKIGKDGVFYYDGMTIKGAPYVAGVYAGFRGYWLRCGAGYYLPSFSRVVALISPRFSFREGELILEPGAFVKFDSGERKFTGDVYLSVFLFKAVQFRFLYNLDSGMEFGAGVNLFD